MRPIFYLTGILLFVFSSCHRDDKRLSFDGDSFDERILNYVDAQKYTNDSLFLGDPFELKVHPEGFLILGDIRQEKQITIIDLNNGNIQQLVNRGRGPNELISARNITIQDGSIWVSGTQDGKCLKLSLDKDSRTFEIAEIFNLSGIRFTRAYPFIDNRFLLLSDPVSGKRMEIVDDRGEVLKEVGSFPEVTDYPGFVPNNAFFQSVIGISPNNAHVAVVYKSIDYIDIYNGDMELQKRLRGPVGIQPIFEYVNGPGGTHFAQTPMFYAYQVISSDDDRFFVSYTGVEAQRGENDQALAKQILSFDWQGNPQECYRFDIPLLGFDVDRKNKKLYCITHTPAPEILIFDL